MPSDEALRERLLRGDVGAFDALYDRHARPLHGFIRRMLGDAHEAEDVLHEAFLAMLREPPDAAVVSLRAWLYRVARNLCLNRIRSRRRGARAVEAAADPDASAAPPDRAYEAHEAEARLRRAVARLPEAHAELYALRAGGMQYDEIAAVLGVPVGTVKSRAHEMVSRLREEMTR